MKFSVDELKVVREIPGRGAAAAVPIYDFPVTMREAYRAMYEKKPIWQITNIERNTFTPVIIPDNVARASVFDASFTPGVTNTVGGTDMFGVEWEYMPSAGGSMVRPGAPLLEDVTEWESKLVWPDISSWDWQGSEKLNKDYLNKGQFNVTVFYTGWFERLISFMDFEGAVMALILPDEKEAVKALFDKLTDLYIGIFDRYIRHFPEIDLFIIHDDWAAQKETFFSPDTAREMIVPYMRRVTDFIHSKGRYCEIHSCGQNLKQVPNFIEAGWDSWNPQGINDTHKIYELYGDKLLIAVIPDGFDPQTATEEEQRQAARVFAEKFCNPEKPSLLSFSAAPLLTPAFREELYIQSRINYDK